MIGDILKKLRMIYGFTGKEPSEKIGISASYLSEIENNKKSPSLDLLQRFADVYNMKLSSLILLAESFDEDREGKKGEALIRKMMMGLIDGFSKNAEDPDEKI